MSLLVEDRKGLRKIRRRRVIRRRGGFHNVKAPHVGMNPDIASSLIWVRDLELDSCNAVCLSLSEVGNLAAALEEIPYRPSR